MSTAPTLLIGLGGKGSEIIKNVYKLSNEEQRKKLSFVVFDTDANELKKIREEARYMHTIQTSDNMTVGQYLDIDQHARDNWFPVNDILNRKVLTEGAGQVRSISRLAFDATLRNANINELHVAIDDLYKLSGNDMTQSIRVIITSTIAGGTGSGLILPVGLYLRNYLQVHYPGTASIIRGFFILPEIMYNVIPGEAERNNLKCNAYAVVRELDAFLMKGDGSLPEEYKDLKFEVPRVGSKECDRYDGVMPYDFCFLMDAQQYSSSEKLNSFQSYIDHAAETIYAQSIGPTNARSNSSEDNVIRAICKAGGRNRYCGAGASVMRYPYKDIKEYLALNWANECMSKEWLKIDNLFKKELQNIAKQKALGCNLPKPKRSEFYIEQIENGVTVKDAFCIAMRSSTITLDKNEINETGTNWEQYVAALKKYVKEHYADYQDEIEELATSIDGIIAGVADHKRAEAADELFNAHSQLRVYNKMVRRAVDNTARSMAISLFMEKDNPLEDTKEFNFEYWLKKNSYTVHPNAIRYQLYKLQKELEKEKLACEENINSTLPGARQGKGSLESIFKSYEASGEESMFDDKTTDEVEGSAEDRIEAAVKGKGFFKRFKQPVEEVCKILQKYKEATDEYREVKVRYEVLKEAIAYNNKLIKAYEQFYSNFDLFVEQIKRNATKLRIKYDKVNGTTLNAVCASPKCFDKVMAQAVYQGSGSELPGELNDAIYKKIYKYAMRDTSESGNATKFFDSICNETIMDFWRNNVEENYGPLIDVDIISALEKEAEYESDDAISENDKQHYAEHKIAHAMKLALPFIEAPQGEQPQVIKACAYNKCLAETAIGDRAEFVNKHLRNNGGTTSDEIDKYEIVFYQAIYGICAKDLQKFAPEHNSRTLHKKAGDYFKAYYDLVDQIEWEMSGKGTVVTPHIDKTWHLVKMLPDLDEEYEHRRLIDVYKAFVYGLLSKKLRYDSARSAEEDKLYYTIAMDRSKAHIELKVSNGTPCDEFYELLDALLINPPIVKMLNRAFTDEFNAELNENTEFEHSNFYKSLYGDENGKHHFMIEQYSKVQRSIFAIPLIYRYSMPARDLHRTQLDDIYEAIFELIDTYISSYTDESIYRKTLTDFVCDQYKLLISNLGIDENLIKKCPRINKKIIADGEEVFKSVHDLGIEDKCLKFLEDHGIKKDSLA